MLPVELHSLARWIYEALPRSRCKLGFKGQNLPVAEAFKVFEVVLE